MFSQLIEPRLFNPFSSEKIHLLFCNNTCEPPVPFMHNHYIPLIICSQKNAKNKGNRKHKLSSHSASNLKSKKPCGQSSIKAFLDKSLPESKGKLNIDTYLPFSSEKSRNVEKYLFNINLEVPTSCSEKSEKISSSLEFPNQCISHIISVNNLEESSNIISTSKYDNCNINYSEKLVKIVQNSNSASISSPGLLKKADNLALSNFNSNSENISSKKPTVVINSFNSTSSELISSSAKSSNEFMSKETLVDKLEQTSNVFCTGNYGKYNLNASQQSTDTVQKFNSDLSKVSDLSFSALEKTVTATVSCFNSNPEFLSSCSDKSVIATSASSLNSGKSITDSNLNTAGQSCGVGVVSTCNRYDVATYRSKAPFISDIEKKDLIKNVFVPDDNFSFPETNRSFKSEWFKWFPWLCYSPSEDTVYCLASVLFGHKCPEKASRVKIFYSQPFSHWPAAVSACIKYMLKGRKKRKKVLMSHANHCIVKHGLFLVIS